MEQSDKTDEQNEPYEHENIGSNGDLICLSCPLCALTFSSSARLERHMQKRHPDFENDLSETRQNDASFKCTKCSRVFTKKAGLNKHEKFCEQVREIQFCKECNTQFSDKSGLLRHLRRRHTVKIDMKNGDSLKKHYEVVKLKRKDVVTVSMCNNIAEQNELSEHENVGINGNLDSLSCPLCAGTFSSRARLARHIRKRHSDYENDLSKTNDTSFKCTKCQRVFTRKCSLTVHKKFCEKMPETQLCIECNIQFSDRSGLLKHLRRRHKTQMCVKNGSLVRKHDEIVKLKPENVVSNPVSGHIEEESGEMATDTNNFSTVKAETDTDPESEGCSARCRQSTEKNKDIDNGHEYSGSEDTDSLVVSGDHAAKNESDNITVLRSGPSECQVCKRSLKNLPALISHMKIHNMKNTCKVCDEVFVGSQAWKQHQKVHRNTDKKFCHICGKSFESSSGYERHMRKHKGVSYSCDICKKSFTASQTLKEHMMVHQNQRAYVCEVCGKGYNWRAHLRRHRKTHTGERNYKCEVCHKSFLDKAGLNSHENTHFGVKRHPCNLCKKKFTTATVLKVHKRTHSLKRDYKCNICEREFTQLQTLKSHKQLHAVGHPARRLALVTKPNMFCDKCPKGFVTKRGLVRHQQKHAKGILKGHNKYIQREERDGITIELEVSQKNKTSSSLLSNQEPLASVHDEKASSLYALHNRDGKMDSYYQLMKSYENSKGQGLKVWESIQFSKPRTIRSDKNAIVRMEGDRQMSDYESIFDAKGDSDIATKSAIDMILTRDTPDDTFASDDDDDDTISGDIDMYNNELIPDMSLISKELHPVRRNVNEENESSSYSCTPTIFGSAFQTTDEARKNASVANDNSKHKYQPGIYGSAFRAVHQDHIDANKDNESSSCNNKTTTNVSEDDENSDCEVQCMRCSETFYSPVLLMKHLKQRCVRRQ